MDGVKFFEPLIKSKHRAALFMSAIRNLERRPRPSHVRTRGLSAAREEAGQSADRRHGDRSNG